MGSGKSGGGGRRRIAGGGRRAAGGGGTQKYTERNVTPGTGLPEGEEVPFTQPEYYTSLPPVRNNNRYVNADGEVIVGTLGSPKSNPGRFASTQEAYDFLHQEVGIPAHIVNLMKHNGDLKELAGAIPKGSSYIYHGAEGVGVKVNNKAWRLQYNGKEPLNTFNVGRSGVYSDWKNKYGGTWIEQKEFIPRMADELGYGSPKYTKMEKRLTNTFIYDAKNTKTPSGAPRWSTADMHEFNWGLDRLGRPRVFDPGAVSPVWKQQILAGWN